ncbi:MAG TPA: hypothetical protein VFP21_04550 [Solirubrobacterales bacterium]|jgi:hypothetical protein|nr:hypothetical protein [Solirubrobacterales bacterium]
MTYPDGLEHIEARLEAERPVPRAAFRGELRRALLAGASRRQLAPPGLRLMVAGLASSGAALLAIAAVGLAGIGPLGPA